MPTVTVCVALSVVLFYASALIVQNSPRPWSFSVVLLTSTLGIMALMYCFRAVVTVLAVQPTSGAIGNSASQLGVLIVGALFIVSSSIGFFVMVHEHQRGLIEELSRRDVLTGVFPQPRTVTVFLFSESTTISSLAKLAAQPLNTSAAAINVKEFFISVQVSFINSIILLAPRKPTTKPSEEGFCHLAKLI